MGSLSIIILIVGMIKPNTKDNLNLNDVDISQKNDESMESIDASSISTDTSAAIDNDYDNFCQNQTDEKASNQNTFDNNLVNANNIDDDYIQKRNKRLQKMSSEEKSTYIVDLLEREIENTTEIRRILKFFHTLAIIFLVLFGISILFWLAEMSY